MSFLGLSVVKLDPKTLSETSTCHSNWSSFGCSSRSSELRSLGLPSAAGDPELWRAAHAPEPPARLPQPHQEEPGQGARDEKAWDGGKRDEGSKGAALEHMGFVSGWKAQTSGVLGHVHPHSPPTPKRFCSTLDFPSRCSTFSFPFVACACTSGGTFKGSTSPGAAAAQREAEALRLQSHHLSGWLVLPEAPLPAPHQSDH